MFAPYYIHPIFVVGAGQLPPATMTPVMDYQPSIDDDIILLAWYYMVNYA